MINYSTHFFNSERLSDFARRWQIFVWWNGLPSHDGRVPGINDGLTGTREYLSSDLKYHARLQVTAVGTYLQGQNYLILHVTAVTVR